MVHPELSRFLWRRVATSVLGISVARIACPKCVAGVISFHHGWQFNRTKQASAFSRRQEFLFSPSGFQQAEVCNLEACSI